MKRQIHPTIKAHLLRSGFYSLLLLAFCVIPFALGQRSIIGRNPVKPFAPAHPWFGHSPLSATGAGPAGLCQYAITQGTDTIVPGDTDTGNHTDDGDTFIALPFSFSLYDQIYNGVNVDSNGRLDFVCVNEPVGYQTACLPAPPNQCPYDYTIFGMWQDMRTDIGLSGCASFPGGTCGIFTSVSGVAPNRIFNIEWRAVYFADNSATANFEVRLYENDPSLRFDVIYGVVQPGGDHNYVSGVQGAGGAFTQYFCDPNPPTPGSATFTCEVGGGTPTPTPTASPTSSPSATPTATPGGSCPPTITESTSQEIVSGNSVACNNGFGTTENHYWRAFDMGTFTGGQEYDVTSVSFGIELAQSGDGTGQPLTVNLYANHGSPFPGGDWQSNLIATSGLVNIPDQSLTVFTQTLTATVAAGTLELVMEVTTPDGTTVGNLFFIGSNPDPETGLSYLSAADCGVVDPTPVGDLGFPDMHIVFNVDGTCPGGTPTPTPTPSVTPSPTPTPSATPSVTPTPSATPTVTPTPSATPGGCVFGFGYWKTHPQAWPVTELQLGNVTYTQDQLLSIMHEPVRGNGLVSLAHHLIAAKLNVANGADPSCIQQTIADADALIGDLVVPPVGDGYLAPRDVNALKDTLEDYNEGHLCAPSCDNEGSPTPSPSPQRIPRHPPVMPQHHRPPR